MDSAKYVSDSGETEEESDNESSPPHASEYVGFAIAEEQPTLSVPAFRLAHEEQCYNNWLLDEHDSQTDKLSMSRQTRISLRPITY